MIGTVLPNYDGEMVFEAIGASESLAQVGMSDITFLDQHRSNRMKQKQIHDRLHAPSEDYQKRGACLPTPTDRIGPTSA